MPDPWQLSLTCQTEISQVLLADGFQSWWDRLQSRSYPGMSYRTWCAKSWNKSTQQKFKFWNLRKNSTCNTLLNSVVRCVHMKWIRLVLCQIQSGHDLVYRRTDRHSLQNKIWNLPDLSTILPKFIYMFDKERKLARRTQIFPIRIRGPALILNTADRWRDNEVKPVYPPFTCFNFVEAGVYYE